ncbi:hypothetical protein MKX47_11440 [Solibacillus sp. FSL R7-0668]|uniref:hypothetical protein n=1 Tax=Solibacillus sp. FSL R7-0668 TaxID=2921688 RepID=UPI0030F5F089
MAFHSKRDYLNLSIVTFMTLIAIFNPTTVLSLKVLCVLAFLTVFFFAMMTRTATINKDSIKYETNFFSFTISQRLICLASIEKIEKINYTMKLHHKDGKSIHFAMHSPEFISAMEEFCAEHTISIVDKESKKIAL